MPKLTRKVFAADIQFRCQSLDPQARSGPHHAAPGGRDQGGRRMREAPVQISLDQGEPHLPVVGGAEIVAQLSHLRAEQCIGRYQPCDDLRQRKSEERTGAERSEIDLNTFRVAGRADPDGPRGETGNEVRALLPSVGARRQRDGEPTAEN